MANKIQTSETTGSYANLLRAIDLFGLTDSIGSPGEYTCFGRPDAFDIEVAILPGSFTAAQIAELYKAAAIQIADYQLLKSPQAA